jgi:hypothetical protein
VQNDPLGNVAGQLEPDHHLAAGWNRDPNRRLSDEGVTGPNARPSRGALGADEAGPVACGPSPGVVWSGAFNVPSAMLLWAQLTPLVNAADGVVEWADGGLSVDSVLVFWGRPSP